MEARSVRCVYDHIQVGISAVTGLVLLPLLCPENPSRDRTAGDHNSDDARCHTSAQLAALARV